MLLTVPMLIAAFAQAVYWLCLREQTEERTQATWDACLLTVESGGPK